MGVCGHGVVVMVDVRGGGGQLLLSALVGISSSSLPLCGGSSCWGVLTPAGRQRHCRASQS